MPSDAVQDKRKATWLGKPFVRKIIRFFSQLNVALYRWTGGFLGSKWRFGSAFPRGVSLLLLTTNGRRTGRPQTTPLGFIKEGDDIIVAASQLGLPKDPLWYKNLQANPECQVQIKRRRMKMQARTAAPEERAQLWPKLVAHYSGFAKYQARTGASFIAIPHNSNISGGLMFNDVDSEGRPITAEYARTRMKWEPVIEVTQIKGDSETDPILSPNDEFADFEPFKHSIDTEAMKEGREATVNPGDFARAALRRGLEIEAEVGVNPYKFGMIGSTDSHTAMASAEENNFHGKTAFDSTPANTFGTFLDIKGFGADMSAAGLAGVWADANDRTALFQAFQRKEVCASTGPRIRVRFFGGWGFSDGDAKKKDLAEIGYAKGVPMGGDLTQAPSGKAPRFLVYAIKDPVGANLDRVQVVKGWLDGTGIAQEQVYNIAWSDHRTLDDDGSLNPVGNTVDLATGRYTNDIGDPQLSAVWQDPDFDRLGLRTEPFYHRSHVVSGQCVAPLGSGLSRSSSFLASQQRKTTIRWSSGRMSL
jgi:deazaflavin-dependent oxidoreductase (nitroreductase family)